MSNLDLTIKLLSYSGKTTNDPSDATKINSLTQETDITEFSRQQIIIPDTTITQAITLPSAISEYLLIYTDQAITITLNGGSEFIELTPSLAGTKTPTYLNRGSITGLTISNASGAAANVDIITASN